MYICSPPVTHACRWFGVLEALVLSFQTTRKHYMPMMAAEADPLAGARTRSIYYLSGDVVSYLEIISLCLGNSRPVTATRCLRARLKIKNCRSLPPSTKEYSTCRRCSLPIRSPTFHLRHRATSWRHRDSEIALNRHQNRSRDVQQPRFLETPPHRNNELSSMEPGTNAGFVVKNLRSHRESGDIS